MELTFSLSDAKYDDYLSYVRARRSASTKPLGLRALEWLCIVLIVVVVVPYMYFSIDMFGNSRFGFIVVLSLVICATFYVRQLERYEWTDFGATFKETQQVVLGNSAVSLVLPMSRHEYLWSAIQSIEHTDRLYLLSIRPARYLCIPRRMFESPDAAAQFLDLVNRHVVPNG